MRKNNLVLVTVVLMLAMLLSFVGCTGNDGEPAGSDPTASPTKTPEKTETPDVSDAVEKDPLSDNRPTLKFLIWNRNYDPNVDISNVRMEELTGYDVEYFMLPSTNGDEKLLLEMSGGAEYDLVELSPIMFGKLASVGALTPLDESLDKYGSFIKPAVADLAWEASKNADGKIVALPRQSGENIGSPYGARASRFFVTKKEILDELGLTVPTDLDSFYDFLVTIKKAKGVAPLTGATYKMDDIMAAFGLINVGWAEEDNKYVPDIKRPQIREYIRFIAKLYQEGLLDPDLPINKTENIDQKFTSEGAWVCQYAFWDIPRLLPALEANGFSTDLVTFEEPLKGENGIYPLVNTFGVSKFYGVPRSSKNVDHAINYMNLLSEPETFKKSHIGDEGVHYEVKDGKYYPIFPAFNDLNWANQFCGMSERKVEFEQWQARARKTPEMAVAYEQINSKLVANDLRFDRASLASSLPAFQQYSQSLNVLLNDFYIQAVVENKTSDADFDEIITRWESEGGAELEAAMNQWLQEHPYKNIYE
jgi:putative aldouronate transport system substrate-binding protein